MRGLLMMQFGAMRSPRELIFGAGQRAALGAVAKRLGRRALVVTDQRLAADPDFQAMAADLERTGLAVRIESGTLPDVPVEATILAADAARDFAADVVIGVGGGSCLDMAKCMALLLSHGGRPQDYYGELKVPGPILPMIAVPTTAGTGSEVTPVAVLSDNERALKVGISSPYLIPTAAICDPELTLTCPSALTAIAGADALTHAIEALTATRRELTPGLTQDRVFIGKNALSDQFALTAISLLWQGLEAACTDGNNLAARSQVMQGATFAGLAFGVAGTAAAHAIQYPVGALTHTAHGAGVACLMPWVMEWNRPVIGAELAQMAAIMGLADSAAVIPAIAALFARIGIPSTLAQLGLDENQLEWVADQACGIERLIHNNPRPLDRDDMRKLLAASFSGAADTIEQGGMESK
ncbi:iron-containing alcohol dehydrogenase [Bordetella flabilis]|nr:iron-containing alcohol dehydrogenase [Bordetella flabilis]